MDVTDARSLDRHTSIQRVIPWITLTLALLLTLLIPSDQSLWIDEAQTASYATASFEGAVEKLTTEVAQSDAQMPLAMLTAWLSGKLLGTSEWALRAPNIGWAMVAIFGVWLAGRRLGVPGVELAFALHPFVWFYVNEARPYAMQLAAASWLLFALVEFIDRRGSGRRWIAAWAIGAVLISGASMLGLVVVAAVTIVLIAVFLREPWPIRRSSAPLIALAAAVVAAITAYYLWTMMRGVGVLALSSVAGGAKLWVPGLANVGFTLYEFAGFAGLGPARQQLREFGRTQDLDAFAALFAPYAVQLLVLFLTTAALLFIWVRRVRRPGERMQLRAITAVPVIAGALMFILSIVVGFPFWGRHLAGALPFILAGGALALKSEPRRLRVCVMLLLAGCYAFSSFQLRNDLRHSKDDYRTAALLVKTALAEHKSVWWNADMAAANYYGLPLTRTDGDASAARVLQNPTLAEIRASSLPDVVLLSKPDVYDQSGALRRALDEDGFVVSRKLTAFSVWERKRKERAHGH